MQTRSRKKTVRKFTYWLDCLKVDRMLCGQNEKIVLVPQCFTEERVSCTHVPIKQCRREEKKHCYLVDKKLGSDKVCHDSI